MVLLRVKCAENVAFCALSTQFGCVQTKSTTKTRLIGVSMMLWLLLCFAVLLQIISSENQQGNPLNIIDIHSPKAVKAAEFAVTELSKLSDSDIYTTLSLEKITYAAEQDGIFHYNTLLTLELGNPHFKSKKSTEEFKMIVMLHKDDGVRALAIDEFPVMDEDAIEEFYIRKIERRRKQREESFRRLEIEAKLFDSSAPQIDINNVKMKESFAGKSVEEILAQIDTIKHREARRQESEQGIQHRLSGEQLNDEEDLARYSLKELYQVVTGQKPASDFQIYRAKTLMDAAMSTLPA